MKTYSEAVKLLPAGSKWSCSFGYPGEGGYNEIHRTPDGQRWQISNGIWGDDWKCEPMQDTLRKIEVFDWTEIAVKLKESERGLR